MVKIYKVGSLFAGVGGICLGFKNVMTNDSRYNVIWANEIDEYACVTYNLNFKHKLFRGDIELILHPENIKNSVSEYNYYLELHREILEEPIDILTGGFPCQAFSIAGEQKGFEDKRGNLFLSIIDIIEQLGEKYYKPRVLFLENVKNLKSHDKGKTYKVIKENLESLGYTVFDRILNTMDYSNLPQNRERIYIVCFLNKSDAKKFNLFDEDIISKYKNNKTSKERQKDIEQILDYHLNKDMGEKYYYTKEKYPRYFISDKEVNDNQELYKINLDDQISEMYQFYQCRRGMYVRKNKSNVCPTLTANMGMGGHNVPLIKVNDGIRKLTPKETFKLQGFPIDDGYIFPLKYKNRDYADSRLYKQAGNAVSVPIVELIALEILKIFDLNDGYLKQITF
ncbi:DNA-cytosine methyltransferase [Candidatus Arthromitus sp. SFB-mouse-NL]|uniref:DNA (cytosine-5-)-methyltransferase n=1 Tax=Candidatus Arthromitus sp. SFB-mouse-NL TaxID=1508644 RepID=UPI00049AA14C|nr:DNA (cytosine-5-)-methyltransferase [Candidatus Arthromitus sp. SFB-mouse-NL]AID44787.1 DNA-cytosine methyltransferase [Candidatus Arthromitus sp. SFB-mouse-NL]